MPELIVDGETGFLVHDTDSMVAALRKIDSIEPARCRRHVEANFDVPVMMEGYLRLYREIAGAPARLERAPSVAPVPSFYAKDNGVAETAAS
jgi:hypothetical protein